MALQGQSGLLDSVANNSGGFNSLTNPASDRLTARAKELREKSLEKTWNLVQKLNPEVRLRVLQQQQMQEEAEWNELMRPQLLKNMGLIEEVGSDGKKTLRAMTETEKLASMNDEEKSAYETERLLADRAAKAARGELATPGYVKDELSKQREMQQNVLSQRLGARGANVSTGGINTKVGMLGNEAAVKSAYSYGQEGQGMGLLGSYNNYLGGQAGRNNAVYGNFANAGLSILPMAQTAAQPYTFGRQLQNERESLMDSRQNAMVNGVMSGIGTAASIYLNKGMGGR